MSAGQLALELLSAVLKAALLLGLAALVAPALKRAPARLRHGVWAVALAGALLLPLLSPWVPAWSVDALPVPRLVAEPSAAADALAAAVPESGRVTPIEPAIAAPRGANKASAPARRAPPVRPGLLARVSPAAWLLGLWLLGCLVSLASFVRALGGARRLERAGRPAGASWRRELARARRLAGLRRPVELLTSPRVVTPMTWGVLKPVILLPERAAGWSAERRRMVLLHEVVHVRRADWLVRLMGRIVCSIYWPNPLAWAAARRLAVEQEIACDERVVALGARPSSYAGHLLAIARSMGPAVAAPAHALDMARRSQMEGRLMSILDGNRRLRGGRKPAILVLLILAGLVPALAALEPWAEEQGSPAAAESARSGTAGPSVETEGVARVLGELEGLARQMKPYEAELADLEAEMAPIARQLEGIEVEMEPVEVELEGFEEELEPFAEKLEAVAVEMEPYEAELEAIEADLEPFEARLEALESELEPFEAQLEAIEVEMRPLEERLESMEPLHERMAAIHEEMKPVFERMAAVHRAMEPLHQRMTEIHEEMKPVFERMAAVHREMEPLHERMTAIHEEMEPVHERLGAAHERMGPLHERMGEHHERMEPFHHEMGEIHERMRPLHEEMGRRHEALERELEAVVERMLARDLTEVTAADTDYGVAAERIVGAVSMRVDGGTLRILSSAPELREILGDSLAGKVTVPGPSFEAAVERFVGALGELEIQAR